MGHPPIAKNGWDHWGIEEQADAPDNLDRTVVTWTPILWKPVVPVLEVLFDFSYPAIVDNVGGIGALLLFPGTFLHALDRIYVSDDFLKYLHQPGLGIEGLKKRGRSWRRCMDRILGYILIVHLGWQCLVYVFVAEHHGKSEDRGNVRVHLPYDEKCPSSRLVLYWRKFGVWESSVKAHANSSSQGNSNKRVASTDIRSDLQKQQHIQQRL